MHGLSGGKKTKYDFSGEKCMFEIFIFCTCFSGIKKERTTVSCYSKLRSTTQLHAWNY